MTGIIVDPRLVQMVSALSGHGKVFEMLMLVCFGASWPVSLAKTIKAKTVQGVSPIFYTFIFVGYLSGTLFKIFFNYDVVLYFYIFNTLMVFLQLILFCYYTSQTKITVSRPVGKEQQHHVQETR